MIIKDRLIIFLKHLNVSQGKFEGTVGLSNGFVNNVKNSIRSSSLAKITIAYPELNPTWLLTGEGEMLKTTSKGEVNMSSSKVGGSVVTGSHNIIGDKDNEILLLKSEVKHLKEMLAEKERFIQTLLNK